MDITVSGKTNGTFATTNKTSNTISADEIVFDKNTIPNVKGMGARDAIYIMEQLGLKVIVIGRGLVKEQSILPGTNINGQKNITLILSK